VQAVTGVVRSRRFGARILVSLVTAAAAVLTMSTPASAYLNPQNTSPTMVRANTGITIGYNSWTVLSGCQNKKLEVKTYLRSGRVDRTGVYVKNIDITYYGTRGGIWGRVQLHPGNGSAAIQVATWGSIPVPQYTHTVTVNRWVPAGSSPIHLSHDIQIGNPDGCGGQAVAVFHFKPYA
jgi:hypothetical protein